MKADERFYELFCRLRNAERAIQYVQMRLLDKKSSEVLKRNKKYKNAKIGERCFILGNGPSMRQEQLDVLADEDVFVVNQCARISGIDRIKPNYYICVDKAFFDIDENRPEDLELLHTFERLGEISPKMECFFPLEQKEKFIEHYGIDKMVKVNYFKTGPFLHENQIGSIDYTHFVPSFGTVVQNAITLAIYMGYKDIYMLGCDNTGILVTIKTVIDTVSSQDYAYEVTNNEKDRMKNMVGDGGFENYCKAYYYTVRSYRLLSDYCRRRNVRLVNLSKTTVIDTVERDTLENVMNTSI